MNTAVYAMGVRLVFVVLCIRLTRLVYYTTQVNAFSEARKALRASFTSYPSFVRASYPSFTSLVPALQ